MRDAASAVGSTVRQKRAAGVEPAAVVTATPRHLTQEHADQAEALVRELVAFGMRLESIDREVCLPQSGKALVAMRTAWAELTLLSDQLAIAMEVSR